MDGWLSIDVYDICDKCSGAKKRRRLVGGVGMPRKNGLSDVCDGVGMFSNHGLSDVCGLDDDGGVVTLDRLRLDDEGVHSSI